MDLLAKGESDSVNRLFSRIERYMTILCGQQFINFQSCENVFQTSEFQMLVNKNEQVSADDFNDREHESDNPVWQELKLKLPWQKTEEAKQLRHVQWIGIDVNSNGYLSLAEIDKGMRDITKLPILFQLKPVLIRAFQAAKAKIKSTNQLGDEYVTQQEYRWLLLYLRQYYEYWGAFTRVDKNSDRRINYNEFLQATPLLQKWGVDMNDPETCWKECDKDGGGMILFSEFSEWAIQKSLNLEDDDNFDADQINKNKVNQLSNGEKDQSIDVSIEDQKDIQIQDQSLNHILQSFDNSFETVNAMSPTGILEEEAVQNQENAITPIRVFESEQPQSFELKLNKQQIPTHNKKVQQQKQLPDVTEGVDIVTIQIDRHLSQCQNSLEFLLVTLSRSFDLTPRQAAALLTNNNQYLVTACVKGVKGGQFQPLLTWYSELYDNIVIIVDLIHAELLKFNDQKSFIKVLATLASGLYSTNESVAKITFQMIIECFFMFDEVPMLQENALSWFLSTEQGGLQRIVYAQRQHPGCSQYFVELCNVVCQVHEQCLALYKEEIQNHCRTTFEYILLISEILYQLKETNENQVVQSGLVDYWLDLSAREAENDGVHTCEERIAALSLMTEIWMNFTHYVGLQEDKGNTIVYMLKRACRESNRLIRISTAAYLFRLLDTFSKTKNISAPFIYKTLVFNIVESPGDLTIREVYFSNFTELFRSQPSIPIALLVEPLLKQIQSQIGVTYYLKTVDYDFFYFLSDHQKLNLELAIQLFDLISKLCLGESVHFSAIEPTLFKMIDRYQHED